jgi:hypothetical protein
MDRHTKKFYLLAAILQSPGVGVKALGRSKNMLALTIEVKNIQGLLNAFMAKRETRQQAGAADGSPTGAVPLRLRQMVEFQD